MGSLIRGPELIEELEIPQRLDLGSVVVKAHGVRQLLTRSLSHGTDPMVCRVGFPCFGFKLMGQKPRQAILKPGIGLAFLAWLC